MAPGAGHALAPRLQEILQGLCCSLLPGRARPSCHSHRLSSSPAVPERNVHNEPAPFAVPTLPCAGCTRGAPRSSSLRLPGSPGSPTHSSWQRKVSFRYLAVLRSKWPRSMPTQMAVGGRGPAGAQWQWWQDGATGGTQSLWGRVRSRLALLQAADARLLVLLQDAFPPVKWAPCPACRSPQGFGGESGVNLPAALSCHLVPWGSLLLHLHLRGLLLSSRKGVKV